MGIADLLNSSSSFGYLPSLSNPSISNILYKSLSMVTMNGYTVTPHHRQNRRRERPGSRTRRTITRKANVQYDVYEGVLDARDTEVHLPSDIARPSTRIGRDGRLGKPKRKLSRRWTGCSQSRSSC